MSSVVVKAQFTYQIDQQISVKDAADETLPLAWSGGINAAQINTLDMNGDGLDDLLLFDRMANKPIPFLQENEHYVYAPSFESFFPAGLLNWIQLRDFNLDGRKDIFTGDIFGMKVYMNTTQPGGNLSWEPFLFYEAGRDRKSIPLLTKAFSSKVNLQMMFDDLPAIDDADGDGDLDIFNFRFSGTGTIEFHRNYSMERYGTADSLDFERITQKWAGITECQCGDFAFNDDPCDEGGRVKHAAGKSLLLMDANSDGHLDLVMSEATCTNLYSLLNAGDVYTPNVTSYMTYPFATPVNFLIFPAGFYEDVDFDGVKDFISSPNVYKHDYVNQDLKQTMWFYKNFGTSEAHNLQFIKTNFLQDQMIDVGDNSIPAFADFDGDGDYDMFISQYNSEVIASGISQYENVGTTEAPSFKLVTDNYIGLRAAELYNLKIQFANFNGDGRPDLVFTANNFQNNDTNLYYILNQGTGSTFEFSPFNIVKHSFEMLGPENINVTDINQDGVSDLLVGRSTGNLEFWENVGGEFVLKDDTYLGFDFNILKQSLATDAGDLDADGKIDLVIGDAYGEVSIISDFRNQGSDFNDAISSIVYNTLSEDYVRPNLGGRVWPTVVNLFGTNRPAIAVGNTLGGLHMLIHTEPDGGAEDPTITLHPNPTTQEKGLKIFSSQNGSARIISANGQQVKDGIAISANETSVVPLHTYAPGLYIMQLFIGNKTYIKRFVIIG